MKVMDSKEAYISTPPAVRHARGSSAERECEEAPDDEHNRKGIPRAGRECPDGAYTARSFLQCGDDAPLAAPDDEASHTAPPQSRWTSNSPSSMMQVLPRTCRGDSIGAAEAGAKAGSDFSSLVACTHSPGGVGGDSTFSIPKAASPPRAHCRTLKYYPPPLDNTDQVSVDVIDHGSEVLVIRREPSPPPRILSQSLPLALNYAQRLDQKTPLPTSTTETDAFI